MKEKAEKPKFCKFVKSSFFNIKISTWKKIKFNVLRYNIILVFKKTARLLKMRCVSDVMRRSIGAEDSSEEVDLIQLY